MVGQSQRKLPAYLLIVKQRETESLKDYMLRFNKEKLTAYDPDKSIFLAALLNGILARGPLMAELARKSQTNLQEFMDKADEYMNADEMIKALTGPREKRDKSSEKK